MKEKIYVGADHAGFKLKEKMKEFLEEDYEVEDMGNTKYDEKDDYVDYGYKVAKKVAESKKDEKGIIFCGTGEGMAIAANKVKGVRAVAVNNLKDAELTRKHNNANVLCLSGWELSEEKAKEITDTWLKTKFSKAKRHKRRINKIKKIERDEL